MDHKKRSSMVVEVTVISAEGLLLNAKQPVKKNASVLVRSDPFNSRSTAVDSEGGSFTEWKEKLDLEVPLNARFITVEAHCGSKVIGSANIPVTDFSGGYLPENYLSFLSYRLRDAHGRKNGIVNLSVKVRGAGNSGCAASCSRPWMGVPVDGKIGSGTVTGIPICYR